MTTDRAGRAGSAAQSTAGHARPSEGVPYMPGSERRDPNASPAKLELSEADRAILKKKAMRGLVQVLGAQAVMAALATVVSWAVAGHAAGASALIGAAAYFVPNALFALRLLVGLVGSKKASPLAFFLGELFKLGSAVLLLALAAY